MAGRPAVVVFDVNDTLSDMSAMAGRFAAVGAEEQLAKLWFASVLRDGFALTAAGATEKFAHLAEVALRQVFAAVDLDRDVETAVRHVMGGFASLPLHPDVPSGVRALRQAGLRLVTLSNGSTQVAGSLFASADIRDQFERLLSVEDVGTWKPARAAYEYAARSCDVVIGDMVLVAVHPWDIDGASRAGMTTAWINRAGARYPEYFQPPTHEVISLIEFAEVLSV